MGNGPSLQIDPDLQPGYDIVNNVPIAPLGKGNINPGDFGKMPIGVMTLDQLLYLINTIGFLEKAVVWLFILLLVVVVLLLAGLFMVYRSRRTKYVIPPV